jgi:cytochrome c biogenesis protein CcdA/thiol-disulfide isomerase/thioredoxin
MLVLLTFAFLGGLATILAPCIWPVLPIILSSVAGAKSDHKKPLGIALGVILSFSIFTLSISYLVKVFNLDANLLRTISVIVIMFLGLTLVVPALSQKFEIFVTKLSNILGPRQNTNSGFWAGLIIGLSLGIVWTPCAGPILAAIATLSATGRVNSYAALITFFYAIGAGIPLFLFAYGSQKFVNRLKSFNKYTPWIQKIFGLVMILAALAIFTNYDQTLQLKLINNFPGLTRFVKNIEDNAAVTDELNKLTGQENLIINSDDNLFNVNSKAPDFTGISKWLNTDNPVSLKDLKGKVVLVDFWTYTCINCIRTLPHVTNWYDKYKDDGFVVIGVHTPEFEFEKDTKNVTEAIKKFNIHYPVAQDNEYLTWRAYSNRYWPAEYLIDAKGNIRRFHFGEGEYDKTEMAIQKLLEEAGSGVESSVTAMPDQTPLQRISPETYLGGARGGFNPNLKLEGDWNTESEYSESGESSTITYNFTASKVYLVLRPGGSLQNKVKVYLDDKLIDASIAGTDVNGSLITVDTDRLYNIVDLGGKTENHVLKLEFENAGIKAFAFTFG